MAESLFSGDRPYWHLCLLQGLKNYICRVAWGKNEGLGVTALDSCFIPTLYLIALRLLISHLSFLKLSVL